MNDFKNLDRIKVFIKDRNKKNILKIIKEFMVLKKVKNEIPFYYFKHIYRKDVTNYLDYLGAKEMNLIRKSKRLHNPKYRPIIDNKLAFSQYFEKSNVRIPKLIGYNNKNEFYSEGVNNTISNETELLDYFENRFTACNVDSIFFRPQTGYGGKGCIKLTKENIESELPKVSDKLLNNDYVFTESIKQHPEINNIHSSSINTLRIITLITSTNEIKILYAGLRFGVGKSIVDNSSSGGFYVAINLEEGTLQKYGHYLLEYGGGKIEQHPDSGFKFEGFKVPCFEEICDEVIKAVKFMPDGFIGWDVAITPTGPTIVEANDMPHLASTDVAYGGFLKNPHVKTLIDELKEERLNSNL